MNRKIITGSAAVLVAVGVVAYAAMVQPGRGSPFEVQMPAINPYTAGETADNSRECEPAKVDSNCVYF